MCTRGDTETRKVKDEDGLSIHLSTILFPHICAGNNLTRITKYIFQGHGRCREDDPTNDGLPHIFAELFRPLEGDGREEGWRASKRRESAHVGLATPD